MKSQLEFPPLEAILSDLLRQVTEIIGKIPDIGLIKDIKPDDAMRLRGYSRNFQTAYGGSVDSLYYFFGFLENGNLVVEPQLFDDWESRGTIDTWAGRPPHVVENYSRKFTDSGRLPDGIAEVRSKSDEKDDRPFPKTNVVFNVYLLPSVSKD